MAKVGVAHHASGDLKAAGGEATHGKPSSSRPRFWRHFVEMIVAMVVGMAVLGMPSRALLASLGYTFDEAVASFPAFVCLAMTFNMSVGMVAWMRHRGHGWRAMAEMTLAMYAATALALGMLWLHIISDDPLLGLMHALMVPAMLLAMLARRAEYAEAHPHRAGSTAVADRRSARAHDEEPVWKGWET
jgi:uncharacterized membrane protein YhaH (DUF805 family)